MKYDSLAQIDVIKEKLAGKSVDEWASYEKIIQCANNQTKADDALKIVEKALQMDAEAQNFGLKDEKALRSY